MDIDGLRSSPRYKTGVLQYSRSCLSVPWWCPSQDSKSVVGEADDEDDIFVILSALPVVEELLWQRTSQRGILWLSPAAQDQGFLRFSYRLLDQIIHTNASSKRPKTSGLSKKKAYSYTPVPLSCSLVLPFKSFQLVQRLQRTVIPQLNKLHEDLVRYPHVAKQADAVRSAAYLQSAGVVVWPTEEGVLLSTLYGTRVLQGLVRVNVDKGRLELCLVSHGVVGIRVAWVDNLAQTMQALRQFAQGKTDLQAASPAHSALLSRPSDMGMSEDLLPAVLRRTLRTCREGVVLQKLLRKMINKAKSFPEIRETWVEYGILKALAALCVSLDPYRHSGHATVLDHLRTLLMLWLKNQPPYSSALHQFLAGTMTCLAVQQLDRSHIPLLNLLLHLVQEVPALAELCASYGVSGWAEKALLELLRAGYEAHTRRIAAHARAEEDLRNDAYSQFPSGLLVDEEVSSQTWGLRRDFSAASAGSETNLYLLGGQHSDTFNHLDIDRPTTTASKRPSIVPRLSLNSLPNHPPPPASRSSRRLQPTDGFRARLGSEHSPKDLSPHPSAAVREVRRLAASVGENMVAGNFAAFLVSKRHTGAGTASSSGHLAAEDETPRSPEQPVGEWQQPWVYRTKYLLVSLLISLAPHVPAAACDPDCRLKKHLVSDLLLPLPVRCQLLQTGQQPGHAALPNAQQKLLLSKLQELEAQLLYAQGQPPALALGQAHLLPLPRDPLLEDVRVLGLKLLSVRRPDERVFTEVCELLDVVRLGFQNCTAPSLLTRCVLLGSDVLPRVEHLLRSSGRMVLWRAGPLSLMSSLIRLYNVLLQHSCSPNVSLVLVESLSGLLTGPDSASLQQEFAACLSTPSHLQQLLSPAQLQSLLLEVWRYFTQVMRMAHRQVTPNNSTHDASAPVLPMSTRSDTLTGLSVEENGFIPPPGSWMTSGTPNVSGGSSARRTSQTGTSFTAATNLLATNVVNSVRSSPWEGLSVLLSPWLPLLEPSHGLASRQLHTLISPSHSDLVSTSSEVNATVLEFLEAAFSIPNSPFLDDRRITDHHINFHFLQFARNYQSLPLRPRRTALQACIKHLKVLCALARHPSEPVRRRFYQLRILDFLLRELSLEAQLMSPLMPDSRPYASPTSLAYPEEAIRAATNAPPQQPPPQPDPLDCSPSQTLSPSMGAWASASLSSSSVTLTSPAPSNHVGFGSGNYGSGVITIDPTATTPIHQTFKITALSQLGESMSHRSVTSLPLSAYMNPANSVQSTAHSSSPLMTAPPTPQFSRPYEPSLNLSFNTPTSPNLSPPIPSFSPTINSASGSPFAPDTSTPHRPVIPSLNLNQLESRPSTTQQHTSPIPPLLFPRTASGSLYQTPPQVPNPSSFPAGPSRYSEPPSPASPPEAGSSQTPQDYMTPDGKFKLGLDLDEDLDRLLELEALGINAVLDGLSSVGSRSNPGSPRDSIQDSTDSYPYPILPTSPAKRPSIIPKLSISSSAFRPPSGPVAESILDSIGSCPYPTQPTSPAEHSSIVPPRSLSAAFRMAPAPPAESSASNTPSHTARIRDFLQNGTPFRMGPGPVAEGVDDAFTAEQLSYSHLIGSAAGPVAEGVDRAPVTDYLRQVAQHRSAPRPVAEGTSPTDSSPSVELPRNTTPFRIPPLKFSGTLPLNAPPAQSSPAPGTAQRSCSPLSATNDPLLPAGSEVSAPLSSNPPSSQPSTSLTADSHPPVVPLLPLSRLSKAASDALDAYGGKSQRGWPAGGMSTSSRAASLGPDAKYEWERQQRGLYLDETLHLLVLQLVLELAFVNNKPDKRFFGLPSSDSTEDYSLQYKNCPLILHHHLSHPSNVALLGPLQTLATSLGPCQRRLLRLTAPLLHRSMYISKLLPVARGANAQVYSSTAQVGPTTIPVAVKVVDLDKAADDVFHKLYGEVSVMDHLSGCPAAVDLLDCGVYGDRFWLVMPLYRCSLRHWRGQQTGSVTTKLRLYLNIFLMVASAVQEIAARGVVHFDIKGENVLLEPRPDVTDEEFWNPSGDEPPFRVVLADFGEAQVYLHRDQAFTKESRGTEVFKSPEMLLLGFAHQKREHRNFDRRKHSGAGFPHDVWSLGCVLYELLADRLLFVDGPQSNLTETAGLVSRVCYADPSQPLLTPEESEAVEQLVLVHELLGFILVRDPTRRPTTKHLVQKLQQVLNGPLCNEKFSPRRSSRGLLHGQGSLPLAPLTHHHSLHLHSPHSVARMSSMGLTPPSTLNTPHAITSSQFTWHLSQHILLCSMEDVSSVETLQNLRVARAVVLADAHPESLSSDDWTAMNPLLHACAALELPCVTANVHHHDLAEQRRDAACGALRFSSQQANTWWDGEQHFSDQHPPASKLSHSASKPISAALDDALQLVVVVVGQMVRQLGGAHVGNKCLDQLAPVLPYEHAPRLAIIAPAKTLWALGAIAAGYLIHQFHLSPTRALFHLQLLAPPLLPDAEHEPMVLHWLALLYSECVGPLLHLPGAHHSTPATPVPRFTCPCGTFQAALRTSNQPPPTPRHCSAPLSDTNECFCDCAGVLDSLNRQQGCVTDSVQWVAAPTQHVWISPLAPTRVWQSSRRGAMVAPGWRLYTCGVCGCVVCAANSQDANSIQLVANWMEYG